MRFARIAGDAQEQVRRAGLARIIRSESRSEGLIGSR
jgi:hypothetical protein